MSQMIPFTGVCYEDVPIVLRSYVDDTDEDPITISAVSDVKYLVQHYASKGDAQDDVNGTIGVAETSAGSVAAIVFDTLQEWDVDDRGFNIKITIPAASFPTKGRWYVLEVWINPVAGEDFLGGIWILECLPTRRD